MALKRFLLCSFALFLLLMLNFAAVYGLVALTHPGGFPMVGPAESALVMGLFALEVLLMWFVDYRRNRQAYRTPADTPAQKDGVADVSILSPSWHPLRSGAGRSAQNVRAKQVLKPFAAALAFVFGCIAAVYLGFHFLAFPLAYRGDPAVFGEEYRGARVVTSTYDRQYNRGIFALETADGTQKVLAFDGSDLHPGRYRMPATELADVPQIGGRTAVQTPPRNFWAWLEIGLMMLIAPAALALSLSLSRRIAADGDEKA